VSGQLTMYTTQWCGFCRNLKRQLARDGIEMAEVDIERDEATRPCRPSCSPMGPC
jgi:mycoredoxin